MSPFEFVVRRLRWLARVPLAPQIFDSLLLVWTAFRHPGRLRAIEAIEETATRIPGVRLSVHRFGGIGFSLDGREVGHIHGNGLLDLYAGRKLAREMVAAGRANPHHLFGESAWVSYWIESGADVTEAIELLRACSTARTRDSVTAARHFIK